MISFDDVMQEKDIQKLFLTKYSIVCPNIFFICDQNTVECSRSRNCNLFHFLETFAFGFRHKDDAEYQAEGRNARKGPKDALEPEGVP